MTTLPGIGSGTIDSILPFVFSLTQALIVGAALGSLKSRTDTVAS